MVEQEVAACLHELVSKVIDYSAGDCPGVRMRKRLRGDARVVDGDVIDCMNAELDAAQAKAAALETEVAALKEHLRGLEKHLRGLEKETRDCRGLFVAEAFCSYLTVSAVTTDHVWNLGEIDLGRHPVLRIRFDLNRAITAEYGYEYNDYQRALDMDEVKIVPANAGPRAIRAAIEAVLDHRCRELQYDHCQCDDSNIETDGLSITLLWCTSDGRPTW
jgi:hypothetical protein